MKRRRKQPFIWLGDFLIAECENYAPVAPENSVITQGRKSPIEYQHLNLLRDLQSRLCIAYLFITHNMSAVEFLADDVAVMYLGKIVEQGKADDVLLSPQHAYTKALLSAVPRVDVSAMEPQAVLQ